MRINLFPALIWGLTAGAFVSAVSLGVLYTIRDQAAVRARLASESIAEERGLKTQPAPNAAEEKPVAGPALNTQSVPAGKPHAAVSQRLPAGSKIPARQSAAAMPQNTSAPAQSAANAPPATIAPAAASIGPALAAPQAQPAQAKAALGLFENLQAKYKTNSALAIFIAEVDAGNFSNALEIYKRVSPADAASKKTKVFKLRALAGAGRKSEVKQLLFSGDEMADGEFLLEKARQFYAAKDYGSCRILLDRAATTPAEFLDQQVFRGQILHAKGLCASAFFDTNPTAATKKDAMGAWFDVKTFSRTSTDNEYFKKADEEIRRINKTLISP